MASVAQIAANRRNARRSTGPRTVEGKAVASRNSFKHGLTASEEVLDSKRGAPYRRHRARLLADLAPVGPAELRLAERVVRLSWQLKRAGRAENRAFVAMKEKVLAGEVDWELLPEEGTQMDWTGIGRLEMAPIV